MDKIIHNYKCESYDSHHNIIPSLGIIYQKDPNIIPYDVDYWEKYIGYENTPIANRINAYRTGVTRKYNRKKLLDIGIGSGEFIKNSKIPTLGYDVNPYAVEWLKKHHIFCNPYHDDLSSIDGATLWDTLEHVPEPTNLIEKFHKDIQIFISLPIFEDLSKLKQSKHFKFNEHLFYFTSHGLKSYMSDLGYELAEENNEEVLAGREYIGSFVFQKLTK